MDNWDDNWDDHWDDHWDTYQDIVDKFDECGATVWGGGPAAKGEKPPEKSVVSDIFCEIKQQEEVYSDGLVFSIGDWIVILESKIEALKNELARNRAAGQCDMERAEDGVRYGHYRGLVEIAAIAAVASDYLWVPDQ